MTLTDLKPCPFCGATTLGAGSHDNGHGTVGHYVVLRHVHANWHALDKAAKALDFDGGAALVRQYIDETLTNAARAAETARRIRQALQRGDK